MKVVLFCGGLGMRMRADNQSLPKPMTPIGSRPVLWHIMRYYAHFGHKEFILCLGHGAQAVKDYFLNYRETTSNDFVLDRAARTSRCSAPTSASGPSPSSTPGSTPRSASDCAESVPISTGDEIFLANYGDVLTDAPMNDLIEQFARDRRRGTAPRREAAGLVPRGRHRR